MPEGVFFLEFSLHPRLSVVSAHPPQSLCTFSLHPSIRLLLLITQSEAHGESGIEFFVLLV